MTHRWAAFSAYTKTEWLSKTTSKATQPDYAVLSSKDSKGSRALCCGGPAPNGDLTGSTKSWELVLIEPHPRLPTRGRELGTKLSRLILIHLNFTAHRGGDQLAPISDFSIITNIGSKDAHHLRANDSICLKNFINSGKNNDPDIRRG